MLNYENDYNFGGSVGNCAAIKQRLNAWKDKVERIKQQIDFWKTKSKKAADKGWKDDAIRQRHLWQMELDYWQNKLDRFTITEITSGFKNSQKVDTQLISKYAFHYLKTYFEKVDVQKGSTTAEFRKIYHLQSSAEKKDRSKHSHHAKDAAVLTLIPVAAKRDAILEKYYEAQENKTSFVAESPFKGFHREFVWSIDDHVLINNLTNNQELTPAKRKIRKRGKEVIINGKTRWATGDSIRGQLHQETFYGAIKPSQKEANGITLKKDEYGKFIQEKEPKYVLRVPFTADFNSIDKIVDDGLKKQIKEHAQRTGSFKKAFEEGIYLLDKNGKPHGNKIRHIRVWASVSEPLAIKKHTYLSDKEYKQNYCVANATNSFFAIYKGEDKKDFDYRNLFDAAKIISINPIINTKELFESNITITKGKKVSVLPLTYVLEVGKKIIFKKEENEDLRLLLHNELLKRLYVFTNFEKDGRLNFQFHLEARNKIEETYIESEIDFTNPKPTLRFSYAKYIFLVEGYDFVVQMDGSINWLTNV
jgi:CRISPR-associated endonuclease Csn1